MTAHWPCEPSNIYTHRSRCILRRPLIRGVVALSFTAVYRKVPEGYIAFVEELPGANTQAETLPAARANLREAVEMVLQASRELCEKELQGADVIRETLEVSK